MRACVKVSANLPPAVLVWLVSLNARQQFFFQPSPALPEPLDLRLESIEELDDLAVLVTKRVEVTSLTNNWRTVSSSSRSIPLRGIPG